VGLEEGVEAVSRQPTESIKGALDPPEGVLAQGEVVLGSAIEAAVGQQPLQGHHWKVK